MSGLLILASASPRRLDLLAQIGIVPDQVVAADVDEKAQPRERPGDLAKRLALALCGRLCLGWFRLRGCLWCSLRCLCGGSALVLIGFFSHGCPYIFNPASRAASARALTFP